MCISFSSILMCLSLSSILLRPWNYNQFHHTSIIINFTTFLSLSPITLFPYHYHQFYNVSIIITSFTVSLSLSPILLRVYHYYQVWCAYHYQILLSLLLSPILLRVHHYHQFSMCLSSQILLCSYHYHQYRDIIVTLWSRRHGFDHTQIPVGFLVDKVTLEAVVLRILRFLLVSIISPRLHIHISLSTTDTVGTRGGEVGWCTRNKPEGRGFDSRWCHWNFYCHNISASAANRNEYQEYFLGGKDGRRIGLTTLLFLCTDSLEIGNRNHMDTSGSVQGDLYIYLLPPNAVY